ncbi:hypothetical protein [Prevotella sp. E2-28]|uniref:hypothetical protein n=1 Tax=Prevotella sp. E2-28 TaxID=2913620 RepID=UPI001EDBA317|nr:hypothetical protein [Prevotella sp. E2-28]UKK52642.1 hypothetical protein L6465_08490 [Prevotella sp. E2-28]
MTNQEAIKYLQQIYPNGGHCWLDEQRIEAIGMAVKALQEEPASKDKFTFTSLPRLLDRIKPTDRVKWYSSRLAYALEKEGYITDAKIVRESIKLMNGEKVPMATMDEEPVSEDLKTELNKYIKGHFTIDTEQLDRFGIEEKDYMYSMDKSDMLALVEYFTNWQKQQFEKNRLAACDAQTEEEAQVERDFVMGIIEKEHRQPTFDDAIKYGMRLMKEQMMKKAVMTAFNVSLPCGVYDKLKAKGCKDGDKLLIVIKED